jgi:thiol-disulfide isomerase/thioredoxin
MCTIKHLAGRCCKVMLPIMLLALHSFGQEVSKQHLTISGKVQQFKKAQTRSTIRLMVRSLIGDNAPIVSNMDTNGRFSFTTALTHVQDVTIHYGNPVTILCKPGDKINLLLEGNDGKYNAVISGGSFVEENKLIQPYFALRNKVMPESNEQEVIKNFSPQEYKHHVLRQMTVDDSLLKVFNVKEQTSAAFKLWAQDYIRHNSWNKLLRYCWENPLLNKLDQKDLELPESYFDFLGKYDMNDTTIISSPHSDFLQEIYMRLANNRSPFHESIPDNKQGAERIKLLVSAFIRSSQKHTSGFTRDVMLTKLFIDLLNGQQLEEFDACWSDTLIKAASFNGLINETRIATVNFLKNQNTGKAGLITIPDKHVNDLLDNILKRYVGKVVYIDFWAPWCGPCLQEMPASKVLQRDYRNKEIVFLFLSNRSSEVSWKSTIANLALSGEHINLTEDQFNILASHFKINGIPHYVIVDKEGRISNLNAPAPGNREQLDVQLNKLLNVDR